MSILFNYRRLLKNIPSRNTLSTKITKINNKLSISAPTFGVAELRYFEEF